MTWKKEIEISPAYDKREKGCGIHTATFRMVLSEDPRAVQFVLYTGWHWLEIPRIVAKPLPADLGYHSPEPTYEGHEPLEDDCPYTGGVCYYDGSGLNAERIYDTLVREGTDGVWKALEEYWTELFG